VLCLEGENTSSHETAGGGVGEDERGRREEGPGGFLCLGGGMGPKEVKKGGQASKKTQGPAFFVWSGSGGAGQEKVERVCLGGKAVDPGFFLRKKDKV